MRKVIALALSLAVQAAALRAPLVHAHPDDHDTDHHDAHAIHAHWAGHTAFHHPSKTPALGTIDNDRAMFIDTFVAVASSSFAGFAVTHTLFELPVPAERAAHRVVDVVRSHDPPALRSLAARAPPAFLS